KTPVLAGLTGCRVSFAADGLAEEGPLHAQVHLEDMSWNEEEQRYSLSCRCGGNYAVFRSETVDVSLVCCDTCSLVIEILR
ncbi:PREDICTED: dnaJ homolog subfamily C member 24-like, partial [Eurypyga helias]|uniref:dnaJ homolog subfamily C member 24-like n=1 Tax=Eurypyga helias TaxID=54383 RepID=UPI00052909F8